MIPNCQSEKLHRFGLNSSQSNYRLRDEQPSAVSSDQSLDDVTSSPSYSETSRPVDYYQIGYLWSWNFMLTKKWRSNNTGDESFQDRMLSDFRAFCSNTDERLVDFWRECRARVVSIALDNALSDVINGDMMSDCDANELQVLQDDVINDEVM